MKQELLNQLEEKFPKDKIKNRPGSFGKTLDYVEAHEVIKRANKVLGGDWSFNILTEPKDMLIGNHIVVHVQVVYYDPETKLATSRDGIGGKAVTFKRNTEIPLDLGNDMKAATSDALKKAFSTFGVALDLYGTDDDETKETENEKKPTAVVVDTANDPATVEQKSAVEKLAKAKGIKLTENTDTLTQSKAKKLIVELQKA